MITYIRIRGLGVIEDASVEFAEGFNVITGESGAGKSLIARSISFLCGARIPRDVIHPRIGSLRVEAEFAHYPFAERLEELGLEPSEGLVIRRVVDASGRGRVFVNDTPVTLKALSYLMDGVVEIQGQRESLKVLDSEYQLSLLDSLAGTEGLLKDYATLYHEYVDLKNRLERIKGESPALVREMDYLRYVVREIEEAGISEEEEEELLRERELLANYGRLVETADGVFALVEDGACNMVSEAVSLLSRAPSLPELEEVREHLASSLERMEEAVVALRSLVSSVDFSPSRLEEVEARLDLYHRLKSKYGPSVADVLRFYRDAKKRLEEMEAEISSSQALEERLGRVKAELEDMARRLSSKRREAACELKGMVEERLKLLGFESPAFDVELTEAPLSRTGADRVQFLFSANPDLPLRPLSKVASGGELSRVLLALKLIFAERERARVVLFDEVDVGIGGRTASLVADALLSLSERCQVIAITHFPQIAARAHRHIVVEKTLQGDRTSVRVRAVEGHERQVEIERMAGGVLRNG